MEIGDLTEDSFFLISIHYRYGYANQTVGVGIWLAV